MDNNKFDHSVYFDIGIKKYHMQIMALLGLFDGTNNLLEDVVIKKNEQEHEAYIVRDCIMNVNNNMDDDDDDDNDDIKISNTKGSKNEKNKKVLNTKIIKIK